MGSLVETVGGGVVVGAGVRVIERNGVRRGTPTNRDTCHGLRFCLRSGDSAVYLVVEETQAEYLEPGSRIWFGAGDELKGGGQFPVDMDGYMVDHSGAVEDVPLPVLPWHMFLCELGTGYLNESTTAAFDKTVWHSVSWQDLQ